MVWAPPHVWTSIPTSQHTAAQPVLQTMGYLPEKETSGRSNCICVCARFCEFKGMFTCLSQKLGARRREGLRNKTWSSLSLLLTLTLTDCHQGYRKHSQGFPAIQNKKSPHRSTDMLRLESFGQFKCGCWCALSRSGAEIGSWTLLIAWAAVLFHNTPVTHRKTKMNNKTPW